MPVLVMLKVMAMVGGCYAADGVGGPQQRAAAQRGSVLPGLAQHATASEGQTGKPTKRQNPAFLVAFSFVVHFDKFLICLIEYQNVTMDTQGSQIGK